MKLVQCCHSSVCGHHVWQWAPLPTGPQSEGDTLRAALQGQSLPVRKEGS